MNKYKWIVKEPLSDKIKQKFPELQPVVLQLLYDRGLITQEQIDEFLHPDYSQDIHDPYLFTQMKTAVERIFKAKEKKEKVIIYGDYDADGVCGSSILFFIFKKIGLDFDVYLPDREKDGYGLNERVIKEFKSQDVNLIVTNDCGISNKPEVDLANELGIDVIITDHHHVPEDVPKAVAIIHPGFDDNYPFNFLSGGGVAFKLAQALIQDLRFASPLQQIEGETSEARRARSKIQSSLAGKDLGFEKWLLDLVAISTVADMVPLVGENRTLVMHGLIVLQKTKNLGLQKLIESIGIDKDKIDAFTIGFQLAPRINAAGRMEHANSAYQLLTTENIEEAITLAGQLNKRNVERQALTEKLVNEAKKQIGEVTKDMPVLFTWGKDWNPGVIGLVASKLCNDFARPAIVLSFNGKRYVASGRSIKDFNLIEALDNFSDYFIKYGGHKGAAGFSLKKEKFEEFKQKITVYALKKLKDIDLKPSLIIDKELRLKETDWGLVEILEKFSPYGESNYRPKFLIKNLEVQLSDAIGKDNKHLRLTVSQEGLQRKVICFGFGDICDQLQPGDKIDAVCEISINEWNGSREIQLSLVDVIKNP